MARHRIDQPLFPDQYGLSFSFYMINHIASEKDGDPVFKEICKAIAKCYKSEIPISARLLESYQIYPISSNHTLHQYLNEEAQKQSNFLIFMRKDNNVLVRWFGPFGSSDDIGDTPGKIHRSHAILKEVMEAGMNEGRGEDDSDKANCKTELIETYWKTVKESLAKIEAKKIKLKGFAYQVFDEATAEKLTKQLTASGGKVLVKGVSALVLAEIAEEIGKKIAAMMAAKSAAKVATKGGSSHASKIAAKSVPVLGLAVGVGFGVWRWWQGDMTGAGLEVMSGAAACLPVAGTATSLAIDAGLIARDVYEAKTLGDKEILELKEEMHDLDKGLKDLYDHYDNAMAEYEFVREIVDVGFTVRKLEHEIKILDDIVSILESVFEDYVLVSGSSAVSSSV